MRSAPVILALVAATLGGCATAVPPAEVTRFHRLDPSVPSRASYAFAPPADAGSMEHFTYEAAVARELDRLGYVVARDAPADLIVRVSVDVAEGRTAPDRSPVSVGVGGSTGSYGSGVGLGIGVNLGGGRREMVATRMVVRIDRPGEELALWEGRAETVVRGRTPAAQPAAVAERLASALFSNFPGRSGETITVE